MRISVVTPLYNSAPYIAELHSRALAAIRATGADEHEIIFVNDGGPDNSLEIACRVAAQDPGVVVIDLSRNFGQHRAILAGLEQASGDYVFVMDSDLEEEPEWITLFYQALQDRAIDVVYGVQEVKRRGGFYRLSRRLFYFLLNALSDLKFPENVVTARIMSRRYVDALLQYGEREVYLAGIWHVAGFTQLPIRVTKHDSSPTNYTFLKAASMFVNAVTAFSTKPLVGISFVGIALSLAAFVYTMWIVVRKLFWGIAVDGWASVMAMTLTIGGLTLFFNGIMAIYIAKIFVEVKQRPRSTIREIIRSDQEQVANSARHSIEAVDGAEPARRA